MSNSALEGIRLGLEAPDQSEAKRYKRTGRRLDLLSGTLLGLAITDPPLRAALEAYGKALDRAGERAKEYSAAVGNARTSRGKAVQARPERVRQRAANELKAAQNARSQLEAVCQLKGTQ